MNRQRLWQFLAVGVPLALTLMLALVLCSPGDSRATQAVRGTYTEATYNVHLYNPRTGGDVATLMGRASLIRLQEVTLPISRHGVANALRSHPSWRAWWPRQTGLPILWDSHVWANAGEGGWLQVFQHIPGTDRKPSRYTTWQPLRLRATGQVFLIVNVHAMALACLDQVQPIRERAAALHWASLKAQTVVWHDLGRYQAIVAGGDFNCRLRNRQQWWMPGNQLASTYRVNARHTTGNHIDWLLDARGMAAHLAVRGSWYTHRGLHSDHHALLRTVVASR